VAEHNLFINYVYFNGKQSPQAVLISCFWRAFKLQNNH